MDGRGSPNNPLPEGDLTGTTEPATKSVREEAVPKYQWPYAATYSRLYWFAVVDPRNLAPDGWRVPYTA